MEKKYELLRVDDLIRKLITDIMDECVPSDKFVQLMVKRLTGRSN